MIAIVIICIILIIILGLLFLPISVSVKFKEDFFVDVFFAGIKVYKLSPEKAKKSDKKNPDMSQKQRQQKEENAVLKESKALFTFLKEKYGFIGAVKTVFAFLNDVLAHIKKILPTVKLKKVILNLTVATDNAADTAIEYGIVCACVYPVLAILNSCAKIGLKNVNIKSDFEGKNSDFDFSVLVGFRLFYFILAAIRVYCEYKNFILKEKYNERE